MGGLEKKNTGSIAGFCIDSLQILWPELQTYFSELTTTCILWNNNFIFNLLPSTTNNVYLHIETSTLRTSFANDVYNFSAQDERLHENGIEFNDLIKKYVAAIEQAHCEGFLAFQDDIPLFAEAFEIASFSSIWRALQIRFLFAYAKENQKPNYFQNKLFKNQPNILIIEADFMNSSIFTFKTNKFVGSVFQNPKELVELSTFDASHDDSSSLIDLYPKGKLKDLQGREIIMYAHDFRPFVAVDFARFPQYYDYAEDNPSHSVHVDGTEMRICHTFCEIFNCTVQFNTMPAEVSESIFLNNTTIGLINAIMNGSVDITMGALMSYYRVYAVLDLSFPMGRSGITCLVPLPSSVVSWTLPLRPFQLNLWMAVLACLLLECLCLVTARFFEQSLENSNSSWLNSFKFGFTTTLKLFVSQSVGYVVNANTVRILLFACYTMDIIISGIYGGGLSAILTVPNLEEAADSVERFYNYNMIWTAAASGWIDPINNEETNLVIKRIAENFIPLSFDKILEKLASKTLNMAIAVERLAFGHYANIDFISSDDLTRLKLMIDDIYWGHTVALTARYWAYLENYNNLILAWRSSGLDKYWEWKMSAETLNINKQTQVKASQYRVIDNDPVKLDMNNFAGLILPWIVGMTISILVFVAELVVYKIKQSMEKKSEKQLKRNRAFLK